MCASWVDPAGSTSEPPRAAPARANLGWLGRRTTRTISTKHVEKLPSVYVKLLGLRNSDRYEGYGSGSTEIQHEGKCVSSATRNSLWKFSRAERQNKHHRKACTAKVRYVAAQYRNNVREKELGEDVLKCTAWLRTFK